ncbi:TPA: hypothetical protein I8287_005481 [Kluyvera intermedia]|nr:hypothetical protein [Kluyvera intermedia]
MSRKKINTVPGNILNKLPAGTKVNFRKKNGEYVVAVWMNERDWLVGCPLVSYDGKIMGVDYDGEIVSVVTP